MTEKWDRLVGRSLNFATYVGMALVALAWVYVIFLVVSDLLSLFR